MGLICEEVSRLRKLQRCIKSLCEVGRDPHMQTANTGIDRVKIDKSFSNSRAARVVHWLKVK